MPMDADQYCRDLEAHLCRRNGGHLVRIVGPAFETVQRWSSLGIPFKVACLGIDRYVERAGAKATARRRPVRIEFCDADVLDAFDGWRRAVGIRASDSGSGLVDPAAAEHVPRGRVSLPSHLERTIARLTALRIGPDVAPEWSAALESASRQLDALLAPARKARGEARDTLVAALGRIDADLLAAASLVAPPDLTTQARAEAEAEIEPFRARLSSSDFASALERGCLRSLRIRLGLPTIVLD